VSRLSRLSETWKARTLLAYELNAEALRLDRIAGFVTPGPTPLNEEYAVTDVRGTVPDISFLVATTHAGLLLFQGPRARRLFAGRDFYGLTTRAGRWYAFCRFAVGNGAIISFRIEHGRAVDARTEIAGLMRGVHQIDFIDDSLWIVDTFQDRILVVPEHAVGPGWRRHVRTYYPIGRSGIGREQPNHAHFNSVLGWQGGIYLIAHHEGAKTGRDSELYLLDGVGAVRGCEALGGSDCHNIGFLDGERVFCRSKEGAVRVGDQDVLRLDGYVRGLALGDDYQIVGTSAVADSRAQRADGSGSIVVTDRAFQPLATIMLPRTQVYEVRRVDRPDLGLSASQRPVVGTDAPARSALLTVPE
jgi:hypothetical protein